MPGRRTTVSGDASPAMPRSTAPEGYRPTRIKLKFGKRTDTPSEAEPEPVPSGRPKRKSARPVRYSEEVPKIETRKKFTPPLPEMLQPEPAQEPSSRLSSPPEFVKAASVRAVSVKEDIDDDKPRGYTADFLSNFIEDASPENDSPRDEDVIMDDTRGSSEGETEPESTEPTSLPPAIPISSDIEITDTARQQQSEDPEIIIKKLQVACHALSNLNIPAPILRIDPPSPPREQSEPTTKEQVNYLLSAAMDDSLVEVKELASPHVGSLDEDLDVMVRNAMQILRSNIVEKNQLAGRLRTASRQSSGRGGRSKRPAAAAHSVDTEKFAISALGNLVDSRALNINSIISKERSYLIRHIYQQLLALLTIPNVVLPRQYQFVPPAVPFAANAAMAAQQQRHIHAHPAMGVAAPAPHQFLLHNQQQHHDPDLVQYQTPMPYNAALNYQAVLNNTSNMDHAQPYQPGLALPRSGQAMIFSFTGRPIAPGPSAPQTQPLQNGGMHALSPSGPTGPRSPHQFMNSQVGRPTGNGQVTPVFIAPNVPLQPQKWGASAQGSTKGYPFPGAVVFDE